MLRDAPGQQKTGRARGLYDTCEWLIIAFSVTLVFIVFEMQAYTIPTGSMAETLRGAHFRLRCEQCGYRYDYDFTPQHYRLGRNVVPGYNIPIAPTPPRCPSCGFYHNTATKIYEQVDGQIRYLLEDRSKVLSIPHDKIFVIRGNVADRSGGMHHVEDGYYIDSPDQLVPVTKGDRIFVLKCIYQFFEPKRWDVVVFKNPLGPKENYIKRMIARPGETVEIIDGDIYIDGKLERKPDRVQRELWMAVYDNDYQPARPDVKRFNGPNKWQQPFVNLPGSTWNLGQGQQRTFTLDSPPDQEVQTISYNSETGNDFRATYAYDDPQMYHLMPICSDLKIAFDVDNPAAAAAGAGAIGATLSKYDTRYRGTVDYAGMTMTIEKINIDGSVEQLAHSGITVDNIDGATAFSFANVDHRLIMQFAGSVLVHDMGTDRGAMGTAKSTMPEAAILGAGRLTLSHVRIFRDIHYIDNIDGRKIERAGPGQPFTLNKDEYFVCGDNSPNSLDGRLWPGPGMGNRKPDGTRNQYPPGVVPRDYLVGKAFFVYWPGPQKPFNDSKIARILEGNRVLKFVKMLMNIPYVDGMKIIYGGQK